MTMSTLSEMVDKMIEKNSWHLVFLFGEFVEPTTSLEIIIHLLEVQGIDIQIGFISNEELDEELTGLNKMCTRELVIQSCKR